MEYVIQLIALASGEPNSDNGMYVGHYDPTAFGGRGYIRTTPDIAHAHHFPDRALAIAYWRQSAGLRADGEPNRPLTAWTVDIQPVSQ